jgi:hypothetical protein
MIMIFRKRENDIVLIPYILSTYSFFSFLTQRLCAAARTILFPLYRLKIYFFEIIEHA